MAFIKFKPIVSAFVFVEKVELNEIRGDIYNYLSQRENAVMAFKSVRDLLIFTDKRIILIDKKGIIGDRKSVYGILYEAITSYNFSVGRLRSNLDIMMESSHRVSISFSGSISIEEVYQVYKYITDCTIKN